MGKLEKKAVFSPYFGDEIATYYDRAYKKVGCVIKMVDAFFFEAPKG